MALERHQSQGVESPSELACDRDVSWKDSGSSSMSAITFGLAATAVLVSMFLVMAIFEHLIIPRVSFFRSRSNARGSSETGQLPVQTHLQEKIQDSVAVGAQHTSDLSVLMPGQDYPTFIAQPAPLPCQREGIHWPSHVPHISYK